MLNEPNRTEEIDISETFKAIGIIKKSIADDFAAQFISDQEQIESMDGIDITMTSDGGTYKTYAVANPEMTMRSVLQDAVYGDLGMDYILDRITVGELPLDWGRIRTRVKESLDHSMNVCAGEPWETVKIDKDISECVVAEMAAPYPTVIEFNDAYACWLPDLELLAGGDADLDASDTVEGVHLKSKKTCTVRSISEVWGEELVQVCDRLEAELEDFLLDAARNIEDCGKGFTQHVFNHWRTWTPSNFGKEELRLLRKSTEWILAANAFGIQVYTYIDVDREEALISTALEERKGQADA